MTGYRPIQPAPQRGPRTQVSASTATDTSGIKKGRHSVAQACQACRRAKIKCDAVRPKCGPCASKRKACEYRQPQPLSHNGRDARLEFLEQLFEALRTSTPDQADDVLRRMRSAGQDMSPLLETTSPANGSTSSPTNGGTLSGRDDAGAATTADSESPVSRSQCDYGTMDRSGVAGADDQVPSTLFRRTSPNRTPDESPGARGSLFRDSREVGQSMPRRHPWIPPMDAVRRAVVGFFSSSGKLFHVFSRHQAAALDEAVFRTGEGRYSVDEVALCCLLSIAAVGAQYVIGDAVDSQTATSLYNCTKHYLDTVIDKKPLDAIKVCTLLSMYNIMDKATVSLAYVEIGLSLSRQYGLDCRKCQQPEMSQTTWDDYRRSWRTLVFMSSWLSSTLGYISGNDVLSTGLLKPELELCAPSDMTEAIQNEMVRIAFLKANMLRVHLAFKELASPAVETIMGDLHSWWKNLPDELHLGNPVQDSLPLEAKRSLCHMHLLHQGAVMLLYRRIASQYAQSFNDGKGLVAMWMPPRDMVARFGRKAAVAARQSSIILKQLLDDDGIFKRCWLVIFQTYTSCVVLLHTVAHQRAHNVDRTTCKDYLERSRVCLTILSFCGTADPVARKFHDGLKMIHDKLVQHGPRETTHHLATESTSAAMPRQQGGARRSRPMEDYSDSDEQATESLCLLSFPPDADRSLVDLSLSLLVMLCCPFGDPADKQYEVDRQAVDDDVKVQWRADPTRYEYPQMIERLEWDLESRVPFRWELGGLGVSALSQASDSGIGESSGSPESFVSGVETTTTTPMSVESMLGPDYPLPARDSTKNCFQNGDAGRWLGSAHPSGWALGDRMAID